MTARSVLDPFLAFPGALRAAGFPASPDQGVAFLDAVSALGPRSLRDIRLAARAVFGPPPERMAEFDAVFDQVFLGRSIAAPMPGEAEDLPRVFEAGGFDLAGEDATEEESGRSATAAERLGRRVFGPESDDMVLQRFARAAPRLLPRRPTRRRGPGRGRWVDPRRAFRQLVRRDGELMVLPRMRRRQRQRHVLLLIDVSGSMKGSTDGTLRFAHALVRAAERAEVFTLGTRLTRITRALSHRDATIALERASWLVADWDGGTRLGEALAVFLSVPRFVGFARGALVVVVSDGLERGGPEALVSAMTRLRGLAWRIVWLSPLAQDPAYRPETAALRAILPLLDRFGDGSSVPSLAAAFGPDGARDRR
ncbi:vWA domain-containing protein [Elioraea thermophila]|uniref:vWA domain-containing protein n=1 Tax=Elioraea thermophila TaxID=2185104 RepID=UPI001300183B|nr:VWA domain-containing protein [Elioraea thermophila]